MKLQINNNSDASIEDCITDLQIKILEQLESGGYDFETSNYRLQVLGHNFEAGDLVGFLKVMGLLCSNYCYQYSFAFDGDKRFECSYGLFGKPELWSKYCATDVNQTTLMRVMDYFLILIVRHENTWRTLKELSNSVKVKPEEFIKGHFNDEVLEVTFKINRELVSKSFINKLSK